MAVQQCSYSDYGYFFTTVPSYELTGFEASAPAHARAAVIGGAREPLALPSLASSDDSKRSNQPSTRLGNRPQEVSRHTRRH